MEREAIDRIVQLAHDPEIVHGKHRFTARSLNLVREPVAEPLVFHTLQGLADYVHADMDGLAGESYAVHVLGPDVVNMLSPLNDDQRRHYFAQVTLDGSEYHFGSFLGHEEAMIGIQSLFVDTPERAMLLKVLGNLTADEIVTLTDDGVSQRVTAKAGVQLQERVHLPSPVTLRPYRTFREVEQPESMFVVRVKKLATGGIGVALIEADGGVWRIEAIANVAEWLRASLPLGTSIFA